MPPFGIATAKEPADRNQTDVAPRVAAVRTRTL